MKPKAQMTISVISTNRFFFKALNDFERSSSSIFIFSHESKFLYRVLISRSSKMRFLRSCEVAIRVQPASTIVPKNAMIDVRNVSAINIPFGSFKSCL